MHCLQEHINVGIEKWADLSHAIKNFDSRLDEAKTTHPKLKNYKLVAHITNCPFLTQSSQMKMSSGDNARFLMNAPRHFLVIMSPVVTSAKLLSSVILQSAQAQSLQQFLGELFSRYVDVTPLCMLCNIYRSVITCAWI